MLHGRIPSSSASKWSKNLLTISLSLAALAWDMFCANLSDNAGWRLRNDFTQSFPGKLFLKQAIFLPHCCKYDFTIHKIKRSNWKPKPWHCGYMNNKSIFFLVFLLSMRFSLLAFQFQPESVSVYGIFLWSKT